MAGECAPKFEVWGRSCCCLRVGGVMATGMVGTRERVRWGNGNGSERGKKEKTLTGGLLRENIEASIAFFK